LESESLGLISKLGHFPSYHFGQLILGSWLNSFVH
jgi:hypothetical protein